MLCKLLFSLSRVRRLSLDTDPGINGQCRFMNGTGRAAVALASFPGSGNTWVRQLLEQATGVCTGKVKG